MALCVTVGASVAWSVTAGGLMRASVAVALVAEDVTPDSPDGRACRARLTDLYAELRAQAGGTLAGPDGPRAEAEDDWRVWSSGWRERLATVRTACRLKQPAMEPLRRTADDIERVHLAYTTAVRGFVEVGRRPLERLRAHEETE